MAYATPAQMFERYDARTIGDLVSDEDIRVPSADLATDSKLLAALNDASGDLESACLVGGRYTAAQLAALTGNSLYYRVRITCDIAMWYLLQRRAGGDADELEKFEKLRMGHLKRLQSGESIFGIDEHIAASVPTIDGMSTVQYDNLNLVRDHAKVYPRRKLPYNR